jgi:hypothetical protein
LGNRAGMVGVGTEASKLDFVCYTTAASKVV